GLWRCTGGELEGMAPGRAIDASVRVRAAVVTTGGHGKQDKSECAHAPMLHQNRDHSEPEALSRLNQPSTRWTRGDVCFLRSSFSSAISPSGEAKITRPATR